LRVSFSWTAGIWIRRALRTSSNMMEVMVQAVILKNREKNLLMLNAMREEITLEVKENVVPLLVIVTLLTGMKRRLHRVFISTVEYYPSHDSAKSF